MRSWALIVFGSLVTGVATHAPAQTSRNDSAVDHAVTGRIPGPDGDGVHAGIAIPGTELGVSSNGDKSSVSVFDAGSFLFLVVGPK